MTADHAANRPHALVVEDDHTLAGALVSGLERLGYHAHGAHTLAEATHWLQSGRAAVLVCDARLPDGDGATLLDHPAAAGACTMMITGVATRPLTARCRQLGAHLLVKSGALWKQMEPLIESHATRRAA